MHVRNVKNMKVVNALTLASTITKVSEFFLKSDKQDEGINKKDLIIRNVQYQSEKINFDAYKIFLILKSSKLKFSAGPKMFLSLTRLHSRICIWIYIFSFFKKSKKQKTKKQLNKKKQNKKTISKRNWRRKENIWNIWQDTMI